MGISFSWFFDPHLQFSWFWLLEFLIVGTYLGFSMRRERQIYLDAGLTLFNLLVTFPLTLQLYKLIDSYFPRDAVQTTGTQTGSAGIFLSALLFPIGYFVAADFLYTLGHIGFHKIPWLWRFHRVHHSAVSLTPFTAWRVHPLELATNILAVIVGVKCYALLTATAFGIFPVGPSFYGLNWFEILILASANFRHSELWITFGPLNYFISSPAMHQIHHSLEARHRDKNFGLYLTVWDYIFGTLYVPRARESLNYGLPPTRERLSL